MTQTIPEDEVLYPVPPEEPGGPGGSGPPGTPPKPTPGDGTKGNSPIPGTGWGGGPSGTGTGSGVGGEYESPEGGLFGYYTGKMGSTGMSEAERNALEASTMTPIQREAQAAKDAMMRVRAATGNDAGFLTGISETSRSAGDQEAEQGRKNLLTNEQIRRAEQAEGAGGAMNLYGQTQAETMEYLRMLANIFGRQDSITTQGSARGGDVGISWNPGGSQA